MKVILTGHSRGLGAALTLQLLEKGIPVLGISRGQHAAVPATHRELLIEKRIDLSDPDAILDWLKSPELANFLADTDAACLINNAGLLAPVAKIGSQDDAQIIDAVTVNVAAALTLTNQFLKHSASIKDRRLLHISSGAARSPYAGWSIYCATKAALDQHARCLSIEGHAGLKICSLAPGVIDTDMQAQVRASAIEQFPMRSKFDQLKAEGALVAPEDCAQRLLKYLLGPTFGAEPCLDLRQIQD
jgi:benzil reductase ((S)-benzoin forming)